MSKKLVDIVRNLEPGELSAYGYRAPQDGDNLGYFILKFADGREVVENVTKSQAQTLLSMLDAAGFVL